VESAVTRRLPGLLLLAALALRGDALLAADGVKNSPRPPAAQGLHPSAPRVEDAGPPKPHRPGELECSSCHQGKHAGVVRMYLGMGGRGAPMVPSHMFQVRVECVACHVTAKADEQAAGFVGRTFRPSEQACIDCHGERYRGMLGRWNATLAKMHDVVTPKLAAARAALQRAGVKDARVARARTLTDDAEFNVKFVGFGKGVHNVFYAADLLKLANGWLDEAMGRLGASAAKADDTLVRGGYCAVLCHEQAGVKQPETVTFGAQRIPHVRHVTEFGAVCTACHSSEVHKAVTAKPATCAACHHGPQNERCESCHRAQAAFYRGAAKTPLATLPPNVMASAVTCTGCHDFTAKHSRQAVTQKCVGCHDTAYGSFASEWTAGFEPQIGRAAQAVRLAEAALARARRAGRVVAEAEALLREAREVVALVRTARPVHNPSGAEALLEVAEKKAQAAVATAPPR
jgi:hypothetical protein